VLAKLAVLHCHLLPGSVANTVLLLTNSPALLADQREVVSTSRRGTIALSSLSDDGSGGGAAGGFYECGGAVELTCCRWTTANAFVTGCTQGALPVQLIITDVLLCFPFQLTINSKNKFSKQWQSSRPPGCSAAHAGGDVEQCLQVYNAH
jgi:hypothetical protein